MTNIERLKNDLAYYKNIVEEVSSEIEEGKDRISELENKLQYAEYKVYEIQEELKNAENENVKDIEFKVGCGFINIKEDEEFSLVLITDEDDEMCGTCGIKYSLIYHKPYIACKADFGREDASINDISGITSEYLKSYKPITECEVDALLKLFLRKEAILYSIKAVDEFLKSMKGK